MLFLSDSLSLLVSLPAREEHNSGLLQMQQSHFTIGRVHSSLHLHAFLERSQKQLDARFAVRELPCTEPKNPNLNCGRADSWIFHTDLSQLSSLRRETDMLPTIP